MVKVRTIEQKVGDRPQLQDVSSSRSEEGLVSDSEGVGWDLLSGGQCEVQGTQHLHTEVGWEQQALQRCLEELHLGG